MNPESSSRCSECQVYEPIFIHNVRHGNAFRTLCTSCVLKLNVKSFCPICLEMYHVCPPIDCVKCQKCLFLAHHKCCLSSHETSNYICCSCLNPNCFFDIGSSIDVDTRNCDKRFLDFNKSKALLLATKVALNSMNRALSTSRVDSERKTKESISTKKKAKEAIDKVFTTVLEEKEQREQEALERLKTDGCKGTLYPSVQKKKLKKVDPAFLAALESQRRIQECPKVEEKKINACIMDDSNEDGFRELEELLGVSVPQTGENYLVNDSEVKKGSVLKNPQVENIIADDIVSDKILHSSEKKKDIEIGNGKFLNGCPDL